MRVRASDSTQAIRCPHFVQVSDTCPGSSAEASEDGTLIHRRLMEMPCQPLGSLLAATPEHLRHHIHTAWRMYTGGDPERGVSPLARWFPSPQTEVALRAGSVTGHIDWLMLTGDAAYVLDWKTGDPGADHEDQLKTYGYLVTKRWPSLSAVYMFVAYTRGGTWLRLECDDPVALAEHGAAINANLRLARSADRRGEAAKPVSGPHCRFCRCAARCPATGEALQVFSGASPVSVLAGAAWDKLLLVERLAREARDAVRARIQAGGPIDLGDGRCLTLREDIRREITAGPGAVSECGFDPVVVERSSRVVLTELLRLLAADAPRGQKAAVKETAVQTLTEAGLLESKAIHRITETRLEDMDEREQRTDA